MKKLKTTDFDYRLPPSMIAQQPAAERDASRLLVYRRRTGRVEHRRFREIGECLAEASLLVVNNTRVIPARLMGRKVPTGGRVEILLVREHETRRWECLLKPGARVRKGAEVALEGSSMTARVEGRVKGGSFILAFDGAADLMAEIDRIGHTPLPPYIKRPCATHQASRDTRHASRDTHPSDRQRYQTIYARHPGAVAAPTAGLHFSENLLRDLEARGMEFAALTLHVGPGTFLPVREEYVAAHRMHAEYFELGVETAASINRARREGRPVVAVGTTTARALETVADSRGAVAAASGWSDLFIHPPYRFRVVENLLTNFHLPGSTLLMMVAALVGRERILELYGLAVREGYRFYSYGDAMLILNSA